MQGRPLLATWAVLLSTGVASAAEAPPAPPAAPSASPPASPAPPAEPAPEGARGASPEGEASAPPVDTAPVEGEEGAPPVSDSSASEPEAEGSEAPPDAAAPPEVIEPAAEPNEPSAEASVLAPASEPPTKAPSSAGLFSQGRIRVGGTIGFSTAVGGGASRSWFILGVGAGVFVLDGLEAHADTTFWIGEPFLATLTPGLRYVFHMVPVVKPYVGTFYRHYFVSGILGDSDSLGARAGVNFMLSPNAYVGGGIIYEHFLDSALFSNPDQVYPEIMIAVAF